MSDTGQKKKNKKTKLTLGQTLFALATQYCDLWHTPGRMPVATEKATGVNMPIGGEVFAGWLAYKYWNTMATTIADSQIKSVVTILKQQALAGQEHELFCRVGRHCDKVYIDRCAADGEYVEIDAAGWRVVNTVPIKFVRQDNMAPLPRPVDGDVQKLKNFVNLDRDGFMLLLGGLVDALKGRGPYQITQIGGQQGSGKSILTRIFRRMLDPIFKGEVSSMPRTERDLGVDASANFVLCYDNVSHIDGWMSDSLCRIATGGGIKTRKNYTDSEQMIFDFVRPVVLNGISEFVTQADLLSRAVIISCQPMTKYSTEEKIFEDFALAQPEILGGLYALVAKGLATASATTANSRMADISSWIEACLGDDFVHWQSAYANILEDADEIAIDTNPAAAALVSYFNAENKKGRAEVRDTSSLLRNCVANHANGSVTFPHNGKTFSDALMRAAPALKRCGILVDRVKTNGVRYIRVTRKT